MDQAAKWDTRYQTMQLGEPAWVLTQNTHLLPTAGISLDLACGLGANALMLAKHGLESHAWDVSTVALTRCQQHAKDSHLTLHTLQRDVEQHPPEPNSFDVIVVSHFLHRPSATALIDALRPEGLLFYQTFHQQKRDRIGPSHADYLLQPNELITLFHTLELRFYREDANTGDLKTGLRNLSYLVAQKPKSC